MAAYSTSFPSTENPISESGAWTNGGTTGLDWTNVQTTSGLAFPTQVAHSSPPYDDSVACLSGFSPDQWAQGTIHNSSASLREVELHLRCSISSHSITSYEIDVTTNFGLSVVRWNGALNNFTYLVEALTGANITHANGDVWYAQIVGNTITVKCNGVVVWQGTDNNISSGNPGIGFYSDTNSGSPTSNNTMGWSAFSAGQTSGISVREAVLANANGASPLSTSSGITTKTTGSSFFVFIVWLSSAATPVLSDTINGSSSGNTWTQIGSTLSGGFGGAVSSKVMYCQDGNGGTNHIATATWTGGSSAVFLGFLEVVNGATSGILDQISSPFWNDDTSSPFTSNSVSPTQAVELLLAFTITGTTSGFETLTWGNGFAQIVGDGDASIITGAIADLTTSATGAVSSTFTSSGAGTTESITALISLEPLPPGYSLTGAKGNYSYTGVASTLNWGASYVVTAANGTYALTGQAANLPENTYLPLGFGSYVLTGKSANLGLVLPLSYGSYSLTGEEANLSANLGGFTLSAAKGNYTYTGSDAGLVYGITYLLTAASGTYVLTGESATLVEFIPGFSITAAQGSYALSGEAATFSVTQPILVAGTGLYVLTGDGAILVYSGAGGGINQEYLQKYVGLNLIKIGTL